MAWVKEVERRKVKVEEVAPSGSSKDILGYPLPPAHLDQNPLPCSEHT